MTTISPEGRIRELSPRKRLLLERRLGGVPGTGPAIPRRDAAESTVLSPVQHGMWLVDQFLSDNSLYSVSRVLRLRGRLDRAALSQAVDELVRRHEILRTTVRGAAPPAQYVQPPRLGVLRFTDLTGSAAPVADRRAEATALAEAEIATPFDLAQGPLFRARLLRVEDDEHLLVFNMHHIVSDGWSYHVLAQELGALYGAYATAQDPPLPPLPVQYADYACWQAQRLGGDRLTRQLAHWRQALSPIDHVLELPTDKVRPAAPSYRGRRIRRTLPAGLSAAVKEFAARHGVTLFATTLSVYAAMLARWSGQPDFAIGSLVSGRSWPETEALIGLFTNTIAVPVQVPGDLPFRELLDRTHRTIAGALDNQDVTFERVVSELGAERDQSRNPVFQVLFQCLDASGTQWRLPGLTLDPVSLTDGTAKVDLSLEVLDGPSSLVLDLAYSTDLFEAATAYRLLGYYATLLEHAITEPGTPVRDLRMLPPTEIELITRRWNDTRADFPHDATLHGLFEEQVALRPGATAVVTADGTAVSYQELNARANRLARSLRARGVGPDSFVALYIDQSVEMFAAILGILKAGAAYMPLDLGHPADRIEFIVGDTGAAFVVTRTRLAAGLPAGLTAEPVYVDEAPDAPAWPDDDPEPSAAADNAAYAMYTSGSTGRPKGVVVAHRGLINYLWWAINGYGVEGASGAPMLGSIAYDLSMPNFLLPLISGKDVTLLPQDRSLETLADTLTQDHDFSLLKITPGHLDVLRGMLPPGSVDSVRTFVVGADEVRPETMAGWRQIAPRARLIDEYGPTETVVGCSTYVIPEDFDPARPVPIGRPIANTQMYVLDDHLSPLPIGAVGELYIGGAGVARGYLNRPGLTAERFLPDPFTAEPGARFYRTGDLARFRPDGDLEFLGRIDHQVKIRGYRIELGEIEARLLLHPQVSEAVVVAVQDAPGRRRLVGYLVPAAGAAPSVAELRRFLLAALPDYMVPAVLVVLEEMPLGQAGKVERRALPDPGAAQREATVAFAAPRTPTEQALALIWQRVLGVSRVGIHDNFFELGGDSILCIQIVAAAREAGLAVTPRQVLEHQTVAELAALATGPGQDHEPAPPTAHLTRLDPEALDRLAATGDIADVYPLSPLQTGMLFHTLIEPGEYLRQIIFDIDGDLDPAAFRAAWQATVDRHAILRTRFVVEDMPHPVQVVARRHRVTIDALDWRGLTDDELTARLGRLQDAERARAFDLAVAPPMRFTLIRTAERSHRFVWSTHHILYDGWSLSAILDEALSRWSARQAGRPEPPLPEPAPLRDYFGWLAAQDPAASARYWQGALDGFTTPTPLPPGHPELAPAAESAGIGVKREVLPDELTVGLRAVARRNRVTVGALLHLAWAVLLARHTGENDVVFGTTQAGRSADVPGIDRMVGLLMNTLPLRVRLDADHPVADAVRSVHARLAEVREHEHCSIVDIQRQSAVPTRQRMFETIFVFTNEDHDRSAPPAGVTMVTDGVSGGSGYPLVFAVTLQGSLRVMCSYERGHFAEADVRSFLEHYTELLRELCDPARETVSDLTMLSRDEHALVTAGWNQTSHPYPKDATIAELFSAVAARTPDAVALVSGAEEVSYARLEAAANRLARLLGRRGVGVDTPVAVALPRSVELVVALLAVLKAGGAYVPLDPANPPARNAFLLGDSGASLLITGSAATTPGTIPEVVLDDPATAAELGSLPQTAPPCPATPLSLAYVSYTSGSTGRPKGVGVPHRAVLRLVHEPGYARFGPAETFLMAAPTAFDASTLELWGSLCTGARLVIPPPGPIDIAELAALLRDHRVTLAWLTTGLFHQLVEHDLDALSGVDQVLAGGEVLAPDVVRRRMAAHPRHRMVACYGPTENTTFTTCHPMTDPAEVGARVPIGRPIPQTTVHVLGEDLQPVPVGVVGELYTGGDGLARGYLGQPALTADRFRPDPFTSEPGARLYRTGDLVRHRPDGVLEFIGRIDHQVKIRGFRIELGEVESRLLTHPRICAAIVTAWEDAPGRKRLVAHVVPAEGDTLPVAELREHLLQELPDYMVPAAFVQLDRLPLNKNGKVDRGALPAPGDTRPEGIGAYLPPRTPTEETLAGIWAGVLGVDRVGVRDNFFELGGDSILSIHIVARARRAGIAVNPRQVLEAQTVADLAVIVSAAPAGPASLAAPAPDPGGTAPLTPIQRWFTELGAPGHFSQSVRLEWAGTAQADALAAALRALVRHHDALRLRLIPGDPQWHQHVSDEEPAEPLAIVDLSHLTGDRLAEAMAGQATRAHAGLDVTAGPLLRAVLFRLGPGVPDQLVISVHHLAVDTVSWEILLEDLATAYLRLAASPGAEADLPPTTTPFRRWAELLSAHATGAAFAEEAAYWAGRTGARPLPADRPGGDTSSGRARTVVRSLPAEPTRLLLREAPAAYRTQVNDALLTALARAVADWTGEPLVSVDLEGHGREPLFDDVEVSRTVGWFTAIHPVHLELPGDEPGACLRSVKEQLRAIPRHGIGHGLSRLRPDAVETPRPQLSFNYHGQFHQNGAGAGNTPFRRLDPIGTECDPDAPRGHLIEINASVLDGRLRARFDYSPDVHDAATIERLAEAFIGHLRSLIEHCTSGVSGVTPSDFPLAGLDEPALAAVTAGFDGRNIEDVYPLSPLQAGMLFHSLCRPGGGDYFIQCAYSIDGDLDGDRLLAAWQRVIDRHPALRSTFAWTGLREPVQVVHRHAPLTARRLDWSEVPAAELPERLNRLLDTERAKGFDLDQAPPQRFDLIRTGPRSHIFVWHNHHLLFDGWSVPIVLDEVFALYTAPGEPAALPDPVPYRRFISWLKDTAGDSTAYWRQALRGCTGPTPMPLLTPAASGRAEGRPHVTTISAALCEEAGTRLRELARTHRVTVSTVLQAAWGLLLSRYAGQPDVVFGTTVAGRSANVAGIDRMVGLLTNTVPTRVTLDPDTTVARWLRDLHARLLEQREHEHTSLVDIHRATEISADQRIFESIFITIVEKLTPSAGTPLGGLRIQVEEAYEQTGYPLVLAADLGDRLRMHLRYETGRIGDTDAERLLAHYTDLLGTLAACPDSRIGELPPLPRHESDLALRRWNDTRRDYPLGETVVGLFEVVAAERPADTAVVSDTDSLTFAELDAAATWLAHRLRREGAGVGTLIGVHLPRSLEMVVALLGILKAGCAYLPLDPGYPAERLEFIVGDAGVALVLTRPGGEALPGVRRLELSGARPDQADPGGDLPAAAPADLAYTIYTSGSTGRPKGVDVTHRSLVNLLFSMRDALPAGTGGVWLGLTSLSFDISALELFLPLTTGGRLVLAPEEGVRDGDSLVGLIEREGVTHVQATPSGWRALCAAGLTAPHLVGLAGGEPLPAPLAADLRGRVGTLVNVYGPTETTIWSTSDEVAEGPVTIGRPLGNTQIYLLSEHLEPVPVGAPGELFIGGAGLARAYRNRPGLTAERFLPDPYGPPAGRMYRTGDLARHLADGRIEHLGRLDHQVKIRGHRIELGEIEARLLEDPLVDEAVVVAMDAPDGNPRLIAYVVAGDAGFAETEVRARLARSLPAAMIPNAFVRLDGLPLTPNGKVDRAALPAHSPERRVSAEEFAAPRTATERRLAEIWTEALGLDRAGIHDDFFALGGDSLRSIQIMGLIRQAGLPVTPLHVLEHRTIAELAAAIDTARPATGGAARRGPHETLAALMREHRVHGASVALLAGGEVLDSWATGTVTGGAGASPVSTRTLFQAGSLSKHVTAMGVMRLVQDGRLDLDEDIRRHLRTWRPPRLAAAVTLRQLLAHTAGLTVTGGHAYLPGTPIPTLRDVLDGRLPDGGPAVTAELEPGTEYRYSSSHYVVLQQLLEDFTGRPFPALMRELVFDPLGMTDSGFEPDFPLRRPSMAALAHRTDGTPYESGWRVIAEPASAGLWTTAADLARVPAEIHGAMTGGPAVFLNRASAGAMLTPTPGTGYGLGTRIWRIGETSRFGHPGDTVGYTCLSAADARTGDGLVIMANTDPDSGFLRAVLTELEFGVTEFGITEEVY